MTKFSLKSYVGAIIFMSMLSVQAHAFGLGLIGTYSQQSLTSFDNTSSTANGGGGGGIAILIPMGMTFELETGAQYITEAYNFTIGTDTTGSETVPFVQIPLLLHVNLGSMFYIALGGYYAIATGNYTVTTNTVVGGVSVPSNSSGTNTTSDYGAEGGLGLRFRLGEGYHLLLEGNYLYGLANGNASNSSSATYTRTIQGSLALVKRF